MENVSIHVIDEFFRILLPQKLRGQIGWEVGASLVAVANLAEKAIVLSSEKDGKLVIDDLGRIKLPKALASDLGWSVKDRFSVTLNAEAGAIVLSLV